MATSRSLKEELACPLCLELLCDPVTTNCGHNFCSKCIEEVWSEVGRLNQNILCPRCKQSYTEKPLLKKNTLLSNLVDQLTKEPDVFSGGLDDVPCDSCCETIHKAEKSCLTCIASYCLPHFRPHTRSAAYQDHDVTSPIKDLQEWKCKQHKKIQDVFCADHSIFVCASCAVLHNGCKTTSLEEQCKVKKIDLQRILGELAEEIKVSEEKLDSLANEHHSVQEMATKMKILIGERFKELKKLLVIKEESMRKLIDEEYLAVKTKIEAISSQLHGHNEELHKTKSQIKPLAKEMDQWRFMKAAASIPNQVTRLPSPGEAVGWYSRGLQIGCNSALKQIADLKSQLDKFWEELFKFGEACALTFDPNTAHTRVTLSGGNRQVRCNTSVQPYAANPERFTGYFQVLCSQKFADGCHYWDIGTKGRPEWAIGIAYKSIGISDCLSHSDKSWCIQCHNNSLLAWHSGTQKALAWVIPKTVRVSLDFDGGSVSFYSVADGATLLHKYDVAFKEPVYPACWVMDSLGNDSLVLETPQ